MSRFLYWSIYGGSLLLSIMLIAASVLAVFGVVPFRSAQPIFAAAYDRDLRAAGGIGAAAPGDPVPEGAGPIDGWSSVWQARSQAAGSPGEPLARTVEAPEAGGAAIDRVAETTRPVARRDGPAAAPPASPERRGVRSGGDTTDTPESEPPHGLPERQPGTQPVAETPVTVAGLWPVVQPEPPPVPPAEDPAADDDRDQGDADGGDGGGTDGGSPDPEPDRGPLRLSLVPGHDEVAPGDTVSVRVVLSDADQISSVPFHVRFNNEVLEYVGAQSGPAIAGSPVQPILLAAVNPARPDDLAVGLALVRSSGRFSGSGTVVVLDFRALQAGHSDLLLENASVRDVHSRPLTVQIENSTLSVR